jgi:hypothetical protein
VEEMREAVGGVAEEVPRLFVKMPEKGGSDECVAAGLEDPANLADRILGTIEVLEDERAEDCVDTGVGQSGRIRRGEEVHVRAVVLSVEAIETEMPLHEPCREVTVGFDSAADVKEDAAGVAAESGADGVPQ